MTATTCRRPCAFFVFIAIAMLAIPAIIAAVSMTVAFSPPCLASNGQSFICELGQKLRLNPWN